MTKYFIKTFIIISIIGTLLHFTYEWSNNNFLIGLISAVNESTWEHLKLGFTPLFIFYIYDYFKIKKINIKSISLSLLVFIITIISIFYGYQLFTHKSIVIIDILLYYLGIFLSLLTYFKLRNNINNNIFYILIFIIILYLYLTGTINPLHNFIFEDPSGGYGFNIKE